MNIASTHPATKARYTKPTQAAECVDTLVSKSNKKKNGDWFRRSFADEIWAILTNLGEFGVEHGRFFETLNEFGNHPLEIFTILEHLLIRSPSPKIPLQNWAAWLLYPYLPGPCAHSF